MSNTSDVCHHIEQKRPVELCSVDDLPLVTRETGLSDLTISLGPVDAPEAPQFDGMERWLLSSQHHLLPKTSCMN